MGNERSSFGLSGGLVLVIVPRELNTGEDRSLADFLDTIAGEYRSYAEEEETEFDMTGIEEQEFELELANGTATVEVPGLIDEEAQFVADFLALLARYYKRSADKSPQPSRARRSKAKRILSVKAFSG